VSRSILGRVTNVRLSLCLVQRLYLAFSFCRPALSSTHSSLKPQEAHTYLVTRTALKMLRPTGMLLPDPKPPACPGIRRITVLRHLGQEGVLRIPVSVQHPLRRWTAGRHARLRPSERD
jgi:hypothetical protein